MEIVLKNIDNLQYAVRYPNNFNENEKYPVILFLHGAGGRGNDINVVLNNPYFTITEKDEDFPFITYAPLCSENTWFDLFAQLKKLVITITKDQHTDIERRYGIGASMGGYATWQIAMSMPECFAAIAPICGGGMYWNAGRLVNVAVWAFHGKKDTTVLPVESEHMVERVKACGGEANLTIYPENEHNAWTDTYSNPEVFKWFLKHKNSNSAQIQDMYKGSELWG